MKTTDREKNQLIAKFMGYHVSDNQIKDENGFWIDANVFKNSWDWIMPVVEKVIQEDYDFLVFEELKYQLWRVDIDSVYNAVVEFIEQYNP